MERRYAQANGRGTRTAQVQDDPILDPQGSISEEEPVVYQTDPEPPRPAYIGASVTSADIARLATGIGDIAIPPEGLPAVGVPIWYLNDNFDWLAATVVDGVPSDENFGFGAIKYEAPDRGTVHVRITLDPQRHGSAGRFGYRKSRRWAAEAANGGYNVENAERCKGCWLYDPPPNAVAVANEMVMRGEILRDVRLTNMGVGDRDPNIGMRLLPSFETPPQA